VPLSSISTDHPCFKTTFTVVNVYIPNDSVESALGALSCLRDLKFEVDPGYIFAGGDWNIIARPYDTTGKESPGVLVDALNEATAAHNLTEIVSPAKTRISGETPPKLSRLDRWYISHSEAEKTLIEPRIWLPPHTYEPGQGKGAPSDHFPVLLDFAGISSSSGLSRIPVWVVRDPVFADKVRAAWDQDKVFRTPCDKLLELNRVITGTAKLMMKEAASKTTRWVDAVALALKILHSLCAGHVSRGEAEDLCAKNGHLDHALRSNPNKDVRAVLEEFLSKRRYEEDHDGPYSKRSSTFSDDVNSYVPPQKSRADANAKVRSAAGSGRKSLDFLVDDTGDRICDGQKMAELLRDAWEPIWGGKPYDDEYVSLYLDTYTKRLRRKVQDIGPDDVIAELTHPKSSCPGPDGIPFVAYSVLCTVAAPVFLEVIQYLMEGNKPKEGFNDVLLFFLPKDATHKPTHMRPIAAGNAFNRIIANIVRRKLEPAIHELLEFTQAGFVKTKSIEDNVRFYNDKFYEALYKRFSPFYPAPGMRYRHVEKGETVWWDSECDPDPPPIEGVDDYHILFLDFAKAYDSVIRRFMVRVLAHIGVPTGYVNIIWALLHHVYAIPAVGVKTDVRIRMLDGLKQGCPLAPLLFILTIDILLFHLNSVPDIDPRCFADDLAVGFKDWTRVGAVLQLVEGWSRAAGPVANIKKTKILTSDPDLSNHHLKSLLPSRWSHVEVADTYVYLGVLMGAGVDSIMVFGAALSKLQNRVACFMAIRGVFSLPERVRIANTYFTPILSYLQRFFLMPAYTRTQVEAALRSWLIKGTETNIHRL